MALKGNMIPHVDNIDELISVIVHHREDHSMSPDHMMIEAQTHAA